MSNRTHLFRNRSDSHDHTPVTYIELFFDLVFVFAITQLAHHLFEHLTLYGALQTLVLFLAVWWVWIFTSWVTNWLDPDRAPVRLMLIALMTGGLVLSSAIPSAFADTALMFALAYVTMQLGRSLYMVWASHGVNTDRARNFMRISFWFAMSAPLWIGGALADGDMRLGLWVAALVIEYVGPFRLFWTPGLGRSLLSDWGISGSHMAERCALFIIIALGETVLVTGATFADLDHNRATWTAFMVSFAGTAAMWWIYFDIGAKRASSMISGAANAGLIARNAYTYLHMPIVAGIIVMAVADEQVLVHPHDPGTLSTILVICGGPFLFLTGNQAFKWVTAGVKYPPLSHNAGQIMLASTAAVAWWLGWSLLTISMVATAALLATALWEWLSLHGGWQRWAPWMGPLFAWIPRND